MNRRGFLKFLPMVIPTLGVASIESKPKTLPVGVPHMICNECLATMNTSIYNGHNGRAACCPNPTCKRHGVLVKVIWLESEVVDK